MRLEKKTLTNNQNSCSHLLSFALLLANALRQAVLLHLRRRDAGIIQKASQHRHTWPHSCFYRAPFVSCVVVPRLVQRKWNFQCGSSFSIKAVAAEHCVFSHVRLYLSQVPSLSLVLFIRNKEAIRVPGGALPSVWYLPGSASVNTPHK